MGALMVIFSLQPKQRRKPAGSSFNPCIYHTMDKCNLVHVLSSEK